MLGAAFSGRLTAEDAWPTVAPSFQNDMNDSQFNQEDEEPPVQKKPATAKGVAKSKLMAKPKATGIADAAAAKAKAKSKPKAKPKAKGKADRKAKPKPSKKLSGNHVEQPTKLAEDTEDTNEEASVGDSCKDLHLPVETEEANDLNLGCPRCRYSASGCKTCTKHSLPQFTSVQLLVN
jgi:hypothetical protein